MQKLFKVVESSSEIKEIFELISREKKRFFPVISNQKLVGAIDLDNIGEFILLQSNLITK